MPLSFKEFASALAMTPENTPVHQVAQAAQEPSALSQVWEAANRPLVGGKDSPILPHEHSDEEGFVRRTAEDLGSGLTSGLNIGLTATGLGAGAAARAGMMGISKGARLAEAALQLPLVGEGLHNAVTADSAGGKLAGVVEAGLGAHGVHSAATHAFDPKAVVSTYMKEHGLEPHPREPYNPEAAKVTADQYEAMPHEPHNPEVKASYDALGSQVDDQHRYLLERAGVKVEPWKGQGEPYASSQHMREDVEKNNHLWFLPTDNAGDLANDHPMAQPEVNDKFRAVHDYFGHATEGNGFGPKGEEIAFQNHKDTFTPDAHGALASETKGQNSWVNSGAHLRDAEGNIPQKGQPGYVPLTSRPFAEQKAGLLPEFRQAPAVASIAGPGAAAAIDDSDPNDPNQQLKHYGKLALNLAGLAGVAGFGMAAMRKGANGHSVEGIPQAKQAASKGAALIALGHSPEEWDHAIRQMGVPSEQIPKVRQAAEETFKQHVNSYATGLTPVTTLIDHIQTGKGEGKGWYNVKEPLEELFGQDAPVMAKILAATSNNSTVKSNTTIALKVYGQWKLNPTKDPIGVMSTMYPAIRDAVEGREFGGRKVNNFAKALMGDPSAVVVDRWMMRAFFGKAAKDVPSPAEYDFIEHQVHELAKTHGMTPADVQAALWFSVKKESEAADRTAAIARGERPRTPAESPDYGTLLKEKEANNPSRDIKGDWNQRFKVPEGRDLTTKVRHYNTANEIPNPILEENWLAEKGPKDPKGYPAFIPNPKQPFPIKEKETLDKYLRRRTWLEKAERLGKESKPSELAALTPLQRALQGTAAR